MWNRLLFLPLVVSLAACASPRKLSQVGLREPAAARDATAISALRQRVSSQKDFAKGCPASVRKQLPALAAERVRFPECPDDFAENYQNAMIFLKLQERSTLEEVLGSQCHSLGLGEFGDSLEQLLATYDGTGPLGRRLANEEGSSAVSEDVKALTELKGTLEELVNRHLPLERWGRRYGSFVVPEDDLQYFQKIVVDQGCRLGEEQVDEAYRSIRGLEDLAKVLKDGPQRARIEEFLVGFHEVIDRRIQEFFQP